MNVNNLKRFINMKNIIKTSFLLITIISLVSCGSKKKKETETSTEIKQEMPHNEAPRQGREEGDRPEGPPDFSKIIEDMDANNDGKLAKTEVEGPLAEDFDTIDTDADGFISETEFDKAPKPEPRGGGKHEGGERPER